MRNKKTIKEFRAFYIMASSVYAKSSRKRKWGVIVQCNKKHGRPSSEHPWEVIIPRTTVMPEKYYLSQKACEGILRRAERRGKKLPDVLKTALEQQSAE